ncbi:hypothetical protein EGX64_08380 [Staphylococcus epidermidis]|nr:hypothetical protein EGX64_08380 [Staphylococcus epidermidis]PIH13874.1 hypothetical protein CTJ10_01545 [Staphylococcus epidermidis]QRJ53956.1 hypothetical protein HKH65_08500 [Staphylococcus epidermidis]
MKKLINKYFFTISQATILFIFAFPMTNLLSKSLLLYILLFIIIIGSTFFIERDLSKKYSLQEKAKKICFTLLPINIVVVLIFYIFIL